jgi:predicted nucleotidyltransferase
MLNNHQAVMDRFVAACQADERVVAAFLGGSYARGTADAYSDLDLGLITTDEACSDFIAEREAFIRLLGEPVFLEDFGSSVTLFYIFNDGTEGELSVGRQSQFHHIHEGPYQILLDKKGILVGAVFPRHEAVQVEQIEALHRLVYWFWHELSHFTTAMARQQLWWAYGQLEALRHICINLARLRYNFSDAYAGDEPYFKVEQAIPVERLSVLRATFCPMESGAMLQAAFVIVRFYRELALHLAQTHGIQYPAGLERVMIDRLNKLQDARTS